MICNLSVTLKTLQLWRKYPSVGHVRSRSQTNTTLRYSHQLSGFDQSSGTFVYFTFAIFLLLQAVSLALGRLHTHIVQTKIVVLHGTVQGFYLVFCNCKQIWISALSRWKPNIHADQKPLVWFVKLYSCIVFAQLCACTVSEGDYSEIYTVIFSINISGFTVLVEMFSRGKTLPVTVCLRGIWSGNFSVTV